MPRVREFEFPVGYESFHPDWLYNYQLNRPWSLGTARAEDLRAAATEISDFADWKREMTRLADEAEGDGRLVNATAYCRAAEFFTFAHDPDKARLYERFAALARSAYPDDEVRRIRVPFESGFLPVLDLDPGPTAATRGTIVLHGGYDSFIEEFYPLMCHFAGAGHRVLGFEGPGQGAARRTAGLPMDFRWERPLRAVLDRFALEDVTLIGLSMGGWFALRAASFEPRVRRVIASGHAFDYRRVAPAPAAWLLGFFRDRFPDLTNRLSLRKIRKGGMEAWNISHLMYVLDVEEPTAGLDFAFSLNEENLRSGEVRQDVLLLASTRDRFIPIRLHREQVARLPKARSLTERVFDETDHAAAHCQIGNIGLALAVMTEWIEAKTGT